MPMNGTTTTYPPFSKWYVEMSADVSSIMFHVEEIRHVGTICRGATTEEHVLPQEVREKIISRMSDMPYHPKNWAKGTAKFGRLQECQSKH
ncbi:hypothetical protein TNCT_68181 [Trichonephila clavata]|uniref:Uncharacterized protein n=1 Tax=Trichonephila clavata TaxID=2740835 RepID=A0A8X6LQN1_TRICU|nr:hypothetical protein TNCT_68181 [Trichonephila clavata]